MSKNVWAEIILIIGSDQYGDKYVFLKILIKESVYFLKNIANDPYWNAILFENINVNNHGKNGFVTATKLGTTNEFFVASTKNLAAANRRFVDRTKHFDVTKYFC